MLATKTCFCFAACCDIPFLPEDANGETVFLPFLVTMSCSRRQHGCVLYVCRIQWGEVGRGFVDERHQGRVSREDFHSQGRVDAKAALGNEHVE